MAELLRNCGNEEEHGRIEWLAVPQNPYVYMEDVEAATVKDEVPDETGHTEEVRLHGGKQPKRVLVYFSNEHSKSGFIKRNTGTQRLL